MPSKGPRPKISMGDALARVSLTTYPGTHDLAESLVNDSMREQAWRPVRAMAIRARETRAANSGLTWMTTEEFNAWMDTFTRYRRQGACTNVGITAGRRRAIMGGEKITPAEALAVAHFRAGLPLPCDLEAADFKAWFMPRFAGLTAICETLAIKPKTLASYLHGYSIDHGQRIARKPARAVVRALDWVWKVGPFSPYGERPGAPLFPSQPGGLP